MSIYDAKYQSPNYGYPKGKPGRKGHGHDGSIIGIGVHVSGASWQSNYNWIMNPAANASYNAIIKEDGTIVSLVPESNPAYAHGRIEKPTWPLLKKGVNPNIYTLSVARTGSNQNTWTPEQMESILRLLKHWSVKYDIPLTRPYVFGHFEIDSVGRWYCPGKPFFDALIKELEKLDDIEMIGVDPDEPDPVYRVVVASNTDYQQSVEDLMKTKKAFPTLAPVIRLNEVKGTEYYRVVLDEVERLDQARALTNMAKSRLGSGWIISEWEDIPLNKPDPKAEPDPEPDPEPPGDEMSSGLMELLKKLFDMLSKIFGKEG